MFRILIDHVSHTHTYLLACDRRRDAVLIDPVLSELDRYAALIREIGLNLVWALDTHVHADHITAAGALAERYGARSATGEGCEAPGYDLLLQDGQCLAFGDELIEVLATPGHTPGSVSYLWSGRVFTGDALLVGGCGRTDFQGGCAGQLYDSVTARLFTLPDPTEVWPGHDAQGRLCSTIGREREANPRLSGRTRQEFIALMGTLNLSPPRLMDVAVPRNRLVGREALAGARRAEGVRP